MMQGLEGKAGIVTGGSTGIGRATPPNSAMRRVCLLW